MIKKMSLLWVADNCGVSKVKVIHHYFGFHKKTTKLGHFAKVSVRKRKYNYSWVKSKKILIARKGSRHKSYFIRSKYRWVKPDGAHLKFKKNALVLLKKRLTMKGKYVKGPFVYGLKRKKIIKSFPGLI